MITNYITDDMWLQRYRLSTCCESWTWCRTQSAGWRVRRRSSHVYQRLSVAARGWCHVKFLQF